MATRGRLAWRLAGRNVATMRLRSAAVMQLHCSAHARASDMAPGGYLVGARPDAM